MEVSPELVGRSTAPTRDLYFAQLQDVGEWPEQIDEPTPHFVVLAMDARAVESDRIASFANRLIAQGMVYLCAWGPACERVHDIFDEVDIERGSTGDAFLMTTWHEVEELDDALWFALFATNPGEDYIDTCRAVLAVVIDHPEWGEQVKARLADVDRFNNEVLAGESDT